MADTVALDTSYCAHIAKSTVHLYYVQYSITKELLQYSNQCNQYYSTSHNKSVKQNSVMTAFATQS